MALFAIPNGGARTQFGGAILKAEGMLAGTPDLFLMAQPGVFIEMKTEKGKQSDEQKKFEAMALKMGYKYEIVRNFDTFRAVILKYLL